MPENIVKTSGPTKASKNDAGGGVLRSEPVIGIVKNNVDPVRQGRIQVFIADLNGPDPDDSSCWTTVRFMSPFYGRTYGTSSNTGFGAYAENPVSYGEWHSPPDIGTEVVCIFINGDPNYGFYIGCIPEPEALTMVPAIGSVNTKVTMNSGEATGLAGAVQLPVTNINVANTSVANSNKFLDEPKPVHSYVASILAQQGLIRDTIRGTITSSSQRETPSRVGWGVSTPGRPIYEGGYTDTNVIDATKTDPKSTKVTSRRPGHTFVMDDGDILGKDQLIRLRTSLGHQILMSDDGQCLFIIHANGQSWIELGAEGTIDMYSTNSVNIRTQGDLNLHADNNVNIQANKNINIKAKENLTLNADIDCNVRTGGNYKQQTLANHTLKVDGQLSLASAGDASLASNSGVAYVNGSKVNLNTGSSSLVPESLQPLVQFVHTDTLFDAEKGFVPAPGKLQSIASRAPAHQPWISANQGVNVATKLDASENLPPIPPEPVQAVNDTVPSSPPTPVTEPVVATVPGNNTAGGTLNAGATSSLVSATAVAAATGPAAQAASATGTAIVNGTPVVGQLAQTATQMVTGGTVKPGAETLINGLVANGASVAGAMTSNLFTAKSGAENLQAFTNNATAQVQNMVTNIASSQQQLIQSGVITGKESPAAIGGLVLSGVQNGVPATAEFVKNIGSGLVTSTQQLTGSSGSIASTISSGNFAAGLTDTLGGALGSVKSGVTGLIEKSKSGVTAAFDSIKNAYKSFTPNIPQDLKAIAEKNTKELEAAQLTGSNITNATDALSKLNNSLTGTLGSATSGLTSALGGSATSGLTSALRSVTGGLPSTLGSVTSNISQSLNTITSSISGSIPSSLTSVINSGSVQGLSSLNSVTNGLTATTTGVTNLASQFLTGAGTPILSGSVAQVAANAAGAISSLLPDSKALDVAKTGLQGIPGGQSALSLVVDAGKSLTSSIPGAGALGSVINNTASGLLSGTGSQLMSAASDASKLLGGLSGGIPDPTKILSEIQSNFKPESASLAGLASSVLPPALSNQLSSALNSITANNPNQLQLPTVATGTTNRSSVTSQIGNILGNSKIPPPNYGSLASFNSDYDKQLAKIDERKKYLKENQEKFDKQKIIVKRVKNEYEEGLTNLPEGDPQLVVLKQTYDTEYKKIVAITNELADFLKS